MTSEDYGAGCTFISVSKSQLRDDRDRDEWNVGNILGRKPQELIMD